MKIKDSKWLSKINAMRKRLPLFYTSSTWYPYPSKLWGKAINRIETDRN